MYERDYQIGKDAFYKMVGGPDAMVPKQDGASVILRLLSIQLREACGVSSLGLDSRTKALLKDVDGFYGVKHVGHYTSSANPTAEAHPAHQIFEVSGIPQEMLTNIHKEIAMKIAPLEMGGFVKRLAARVLREQTARKLVAEGVNAKTREIFGF